MNSNTWIILMWLSVVANRLSPEELLFKIMLIGSLIFSVIFVVIENLEKPKEVEK